jgi:lipopolysaccharide-induced tumor necrosis factor-alpha factor
MQQPITQQPGKNLSFIKMQMTSYSQQTIQTTLGTTVIVTQTSTRFGSDPARIICPTCRAQITTSVRYEPALKTHLFAGLICLLGCWLGCCAIPYCVDSCQNATHTCEFLFIVSLSIIADTFNLFQAPTAKLIWARKIRQRRRCKKKFDNEIMENFNQCVVELSAKMSKCPIKFF